MANKFDSWCARARELFRDNAEYPLINEPVADVEGIFIELRDGPFDSGTLPSYTDFTLFPYDHRDPVERFVVLNYYFRNWRCLLRAMEEHEMFADPAQHLLRMLGFHVRLLPVDEIGDVKAIRWEIVNACAVSAWERADALYEKLKITASLSDVDYFCMLARSLASRVFRRPALQVFVPETRNIFDESLAGAFLYMGTSLKPPLSDYLRDARANAEKALERQLDNPQFYRVLLTGCYFSLGEYEKAATMASRLLKEAEGDALFRDDLFKVSADAWEQVGRLDLAISVVQAWKNEFPNEKKLNDRLAKLYVRKGDKDAALKYLAEESSRDDDWLATFLVQTHTLALENESRFKIIRQQIDDRFDKHPRDRDFISKVVAGNWPEFTKLSEPSQKAWLTATILRCLPDLGDADPLGQALGKAIEQELRATIFEPFRQSYRANQAVPKKDTLHNFLRTGKIRLGEMIGVLLDPAGQNDRTYKDFAHWLKEKGYDQHQYSDLEKINPPWGSAKHDPKGVTDEQAEELYQLSRRFLTRFVNAHRPARAVPSI